MNFYVNDILDFTQIRNNKLRKNISGFNASKAIQETADILQDQAQFKNIEVIIN